MSAALNTHGNASSQYDGTPKDLSLGGLSGLSTPAHKYRVPSASSQTTAPSSVTLLTPSPTSAHHTRRRTDGTDNSAEFTPLPNKLNLSVKFENSPTDDATPASYTQDDDPDLLATPSISRVLSSRRKSGGKTSNLTLRDQEKHIDALKKENFNIKLKVHFLEERLAQLAPDQIDAALKQNINLKIEVQQRGIEMKKYKKLVLELERELERLQRSQGSSRERELEEKLAERERELRDLRRRRTGIGGASEGEALREAQVRNGELEDQVDQLNEDIENAKVLLEENMDEIERLKDLVQRRGGEEGEGSTQVTQLEKRLEELEVANEELVIRLEEQSELLTQREEEKEDLTDVIEELRLKLEELERRREAESIERSASRVAMLEEREEREAVEEDLNALRDKLAAAAIEISQKDDEIEMKNREIQDLIGEHERIVESVEQEWRGEVEEARTQVEELRDVIVERDVESKELRLHISELESNTNDLHTKFETALEHLEQEAEDKDAEIENANREIEKLGQRVYELEDEIDHLKDESVQLLDEEAVERERLEALAAALKEKHSAVKAQLQEITELYESSLQEALAHRERQEELAKHVETLVEEIHRERDEREKLEAEFRTEAAKLESEIQKQRRHVQSQESELESTHSEISRIKSLLTRRDQDVAELQEVLETLEQESKKAGESHTSDRFSLQLEVDRLKRDVERLEDDLLRSRRQLEERDGKYRDREDALDSLHTQNRDLASQLSAQTQARLNLSEKLDAVQASLKSTEADLAVYKSKVADLDKRLSKDQRALLNTETQYRDQLTERNTLLLTVYQYTDKILGVDNTPKSSETKPFTNFSAFHDNLLSRLKNLSKINQDFEKRCKDLESRYMEKAADLKKQLDVRWKQIDKFEASVKNLAETKQAWRKKVNTKESELEVLKITNSDLLSQLSSLKRPGTSEASELKSLHSRAVNAERRLANSLNQLASLEEKIASMNERTTITDGKWEARVKEYETRLKAAEERVKRERQGAKERVVELETSIKGLQRQIDLAHKRNQQLNDVVDLTKQTAPFS